MKDAKCDYTTVETENATHKLRSIQQTLSEECLKTFTNNMKCTSTLSMYYVILEYEHELLV